MTESTEKENILRQKLIDAHNNFIGVNSVYESTKEAINNIILMHNENNKRREEALKLKEQALKELSEFLTEQHNLNKKH